MGSPVYRGLPSDVRKNIQHFGIRNGVLLTIAPTGTTSLYAGNVSSGLEPVFQHKARRNVRQEDDTFKPYTVYDYGYLLWCSVKGLQPDSDLAMPDYMVAHDDLSGEAHIRMQAACQRYIDASVSKTINCREDMTFEEFKTLYEMAWEEGCKGCTTYRYSEVRGSILSGTSVGQSANAKAEITEEKPLKRPEVLTGRTYKVKWPSVGENYYITINDVAGAPFEVFIQSTSAKFADWTTALSLMISAIMRKGGDIHFIPEELSKVKSAEDSGWVEGKFYGSLVALIGATIGKHFESRDIKRAKQVSVAKSQIQITPINPTRGETCPQCHQPTVIRLEGCDRCTSCDYSRCG